MPWDVTDQYIRSGHRKSSGTCRTISLSAAQGIKAIYCKFGKKWTITSYLFKKAKGWNLKKAKTWFSQHRTEKYEEVLSEGLTVIVPGDKEDKRTSQLHPDFIRMRAIFVRRFGEVVGVQKYIQFVEQNKLKQTRRYHPHAQFHESVQLNESFEWATPLITFLKKDANAKYYKIVALTANISMNNNDYSDPLKMAKAAPTLNYMPVNMNHNHRSWFRYPHTRLDWAHFDDMSVEGLLRVDNSEKMLQKMLDHDPSIDEKLWIYHPSIEARPIPAHMGGGYHFTGIALLQKGYALPGDPCTEIQPLFMESVHTSLEKQFLVTCRIVDGKIVCKEEKSLNPTANNKTGSKDSVSSEAEKLMVTQEQLQEMTIDEIKAKILEVNKKIDTLDKKLYGGPETVKAAPKQDSAERTKLRAEMDILRAELKAYLDALGSKTFGKAQSSTEAKEQLEKLKDDLATTKETLENERLEHTEDLNETKQLLKIEKKKTEKLTKENGKLQEISPKMEVLQESLTKANEEKLNLKTKIREQKRKLIGFEENLKVSKEANKRIVKDAERVNEINDRLQIDLTKEKTTVREQREKNTELTTELNKGKKENSKLVSFNEKMTDDCKELRGQLTGRDEDVAAANIAKREAQEELDSFKEESKAKFEEMKTGLETKLEEATTKIETMNTEHGQYKESIKEELENLERKSTIQEKQIAKLKKAVDGKKIEAAKKGVISMKDGKVDLPKGVKIK